MENQWYLYSNGQQSGPHTWDDLTDMASLGSLSSTDLAWKQGMSDWAPVNQISGLMVNSGAPSPPDFPPSTPPPSSTPANYQGSPVKKKSKAPLIIILSVLAVAVLGIGIIFYVVISNFLAAPEDNGRPSIPGIDDDTVSEIIPGVDDGTASEAVPGVEPSPDADETEMIIGAWHGTDDLGGEGYFQFLEDGTFNIAFTDEGVWQTTRYRLIEEGQTTQLEAYDPHFEDWDRLASVTFEGNDRMHMVDHYVGDSLYFQRISHDQFENILQGLERVDF